VLALTVVVTGVAAIGLTNEVFAGFQRRATDSLFPAAPDSGEVVVVGFDRKTISDPTLGNPLPREQVAALISKLNALGAKVIAFDVVYASERSDQVAGDRAIGAAIDAGKADVILATKPVSDPGVDGDVLSAQLTGFADGLVSTSSSFLPASAAFSADPTDGVNRTVPMVIERSGDKLFVPALSLAAVMRLRGDGGQVIVRPHGVQIGDRLVPTGDVKSLTVNFTGELSSSESPKVMSVADVLGGKVARSSVAGKIVFVGALDSTLGDNKLAPVNKATGIPGVLLHANAANTMLTGNRAHRCRRVGAAAVDVGDLHLHRRLRLRDLRLRPLQPGPGLQLHLPVDRGGARVRGRVGSAVLR
jgi:CHASE2 domain-containing sensor protein